MYELLHVPTNQVFGRFKSTKEIFDWLDEHQYLKRSDCVIKFYQLIETMRLK